jgi:glycosyltransferase involved in cell wall biosynthesis
MQVARLVDVKDHATSIRAVGCLASRYPSLRLLIVGDGPERPSIERLIDELGLREQVFLLGARNDVDRLLQAADLFILSSVTEAIPLTLIEAMAAELACVGSRVGGIPEVIAENETGLLAEPRDHQAFADCVERLMADTESRSRMGKAARSRAEMLFNRDAMLEAYYAHFRQLVGNSK